MQSFGDFAASKAGLTWSGRLILPQRPPGSKPGVLLLNYSLMKAHWTGKGSPCPQCPGTGAWNRTKTNAVSERHAATTTSHQHRFVGNPKFSAGVRSLTVNHTAERTEFTQTDAPTSTASTAGAASYQVLSHLTV